MMLLSAINKTSKTNADLPFLSNYGSDARRNMELHQHLQQLANKDILWKLLSGNIVVPPDIDVNVYMRH